jgi:site-specific DNA-methyltransferase (adenine-specific)
MTHTTLYELHTGDCRDVLQSMLPDARGSVDVIVTSPPYNIGVAYGAHNDRMHADEYRQMLSRVFSRLHQVLARDGALFLNVGAKPSDAAFPFMVAELARQYFVMQNVIHWIKAISVPDTCDANSPEAIRSHGHYKPINSPRYLNDCAEYVFHLTRAGDAKIDRLAIGVPYQDKSNIARWKAAGKSSGLRCRGNTWYVPYKTIQSRAGERPHPATFPVQLAEMCIKLHGVERVRHVMDPFCGIGTTGVAAVNLGVARFTGIDVDAQYCAEAARRIDAAKAKGAQGQGA